MTLNHLNQVILRTIHSAIPADQKQSFENFQRQMDEACLKFQGTREQSISFDEMDDGERFTTTTCILFESLGRCLYWLDSPERRHLLYQVETLVNYHYHANLETDSVDQWIQMKRSEKFRYGKQIF